MRRPKKERPQGLPTTAKSKRPRKPKCQVQKNRDAGIAFEDRMSSFFKKYLKDRDIIAAIFRLPSGRNFNQPIDIIIDSREFGYIGCECKSIDDSVMNTERINLKQLSRKSAEFGHQFKKQHEFLRTGGRFGIIAFWFKGAGITVIVPHQYVYEMIEEGHINITISEIISTGFIVDSNNPESLKLYIHKRCKTV